MSLSKKISFLLVYLLVPLPFIGFLIGGLGSFFAFYMVFACIPLFDLWLKDSDNPSPEQEQDLLNDRFFLMITILYLPVQILFLAYAFYLVHTTSLQWYEWLAFAVSIGLITGGVGMNVAHEMMHKNSPVQHVISKILLSMVCYGHFFIEHVRGHHVRVATPDDCSSARLGESLYHFLPRTLFGSLSSAWNLECRRLQQKKHALWSYHNQFWWIIMAPIAIAIACYMYGGFMLVAFFLTQALFAILLLELINYIEHYGLQRQKLANGLYERVSPCHSWNANHWLSNMILFHLQRHSDHHTYGARPYQILRHVDESPQLPSGYLGMMVLALFPPLWHAVMDKRAIAYQAHLINQTEDHFSSLQTNIE